MHKKGTHMASSTGRAGSYATQPEGYRAFIPRDLPPDPPVKIEAHDLLGLLSEANVALGRLDGAAGTLPNPDLFVMMYLRKEAVLSSQIEGTQSSLSDLLQFEAGTFRQDTPRDVVEVRNYVAAMHEGLQQIKDGTPLSLQLIQRLHIMLLHKARGGGRRPGELREVQNWIGPEGSTIDKAIFVPPPPRLMVEALNRLELFILEADPHLPTLIQAGCVHSQFETIHPFLDGNGRMGRLMITFMLARGRILSRPLLYLSYFFRANRPEYYARLQAVRDEGDWEGWLAFFLRGVTEVSEQATQSARKIVRLRDRHRELIQSKMGARAGKGLQLLDSLYSSPYVTVPGATQLMKCTYPSALSVVDEFARYDLLKEVTGYRRNRLFEYQPYMSILTEGDRPSAG